VLKLQITRASGEVSEHLITPAVEYAFEIYAKKGFGKAFSEDAKQSDVYWLAWECLRKSGETVPMFGLPFVETLTEVKVLDAEVPNA
jgi:hypothetical protein